MLLVQNCFVKSSLYASPAHRQQRLPPGPVGSRLNSIDSCGESADRMFAKEFLLPIIAGFLLFHFALAVILHWWFS